MIPVSRVHWTRCWRIIPTQYPAVRLFEGLVDPKEEAIVSEIIDATSPRARAQGEKASKPDQYVNAPLCYFSTEPGRFTTRFFGAYYTAKTLRTAVVETAYHTARFLSRTDEPAGQSFRRVLVASLEGDLHDLRGQKKTRKDVYSPGSYNASQKLAATLSKNGSPGVVYDSVRDSKGECAAVYDPACLSHCRQERTLVYAWDGHRVREVLELRHFLKMEGKPGRP